MRVLKCLLQEKKVVVHLSVFCFLRGHLQWNFKPLSHREMNQNSTFWEKLFAFLCIFEGMTEKIIIWNAFYKIKNIDILLYFKHTYKFFMINLAKEYGLKNSI